MKNAKMMKQAEARECWRDLLTDDLQEVLRDVDSEACAWIGAQVLVAASGGDVGAAVKILAVAVDWWSWRTTQDTERQAGR